MGVDRTTAFRQAVVKARLSGPPTSTVAPAAPLPSQFAQLASQAGHELADTYGKLGRLTDLVKSTHGQLSFGNRSAEIQELTFVIKQDITELKHRLEMLRQLQASRHGKQSVQHSESVVVSLQENLKRTTVEFQQILSQRTESMKSQKELIEEYGGSSSLVAAPPMHFSARSSPASGTAAKRGGYQLLSLDGDGADGLALDLGGGGGGQMQQHGGLLVQDNNYAASRLAAITQITDTMGELQTLFSQLGELVMAQQNDLDRLDQNLTDTEVHITGAQSALAQYLRSISGNRWLAIKLFLILIVFVVVFLVFFV